MTIDNKKSIFRIWMRKLIVTLVFAISLILIGFLDAFDNSEALISQVHLVISISIIYILLSISGLFRKPYYFYFDDSTDVLIIRYYPFGFMSHRKNSIQIPKQHFVDYKIEKFFLGSEERIIFSQLYRNDIAQYPAISLSALSKKDRKKLKATLDTYKKSKK